MRWDRYPRPLAAAASLRGHFHDVIHDLREAGFPFENEWFAPHFEFRFPRIGDLEVRDLQIELRTALEPWHVLGEEPGGGGTVRTWTVR